MKKNLVALLLGWMLATNIDLMFTVTTFLFGVAAGILIGRW